MPFTLFSKNTTLADVIAQRRYDANAIADLEKQKLPGRDITGIRDEPTAHDDLRTGDAWGDEYTSTTHTHRLVRVSGALVWDKQPHNTAW